MTSNDRVAFSSGSTAAERKTDVTGSTERKYGSGRKRTARTTENTDAVEELVLSQDKNLCGRDGRTICGPQCVPKSTSVTLAVDEKTLPMATITGRTDRQTDRRTDRVRRNMRPPPREEGRIKTHLHSNS